jgi:hypothetical protein
MTFIEAQIIIKKLLTQYGFEVVKQKVGTLTVERIEKENEEAFFVYSSNNRKVYQFHLGSIDSKIYPSLIEIEEMISNFCKSSDFNKKFEKFYNETFL